MVVLLRLPDVLVMMYPLVVSVMGSYFMTVRVVDQKKSLPQIKSSGVSTRAFNYAKGIDYLP